MTLTPTDNRCWAPAPEVTNWLCSQIAPGAKVLEIGPGPNQDRWFPRATHYVDFVRYPDLPERVANVWYQLDLTRHALPFPDKSFDYVFCRHMLEDMFDPFPICAEMSRVAKAGFIETPSPIVEMVRGAEVVSSDDGAVMPAPWRGYHHHRFMAWVHEDGINFTSKYPLIEFMGDGPNEGIERMLRTGSRYWNTYYAWSDAIKLKHHQSPLDFDLMRGYPSMIATACEQSHAATDRFCELVMQAKAA